MPSGAERTGIGRCFPVYKSRACLSYCCLVISERIKELLAQLLRAENPSVVEVVAAQLQTAIDEYVRNTKLRTSPEPSSSAIRASV